MESPGRLIRRSLVSTLTPDLQEIRRQELDNIPRKAKRAAALAIHDQVVRHPRMTARALGVGYASPDLESVGCGYHSVVFRTGANVLKVNQRSMFFDPAQRQEILHEQRRRNDIMANYLGGFVVPQRNFIDRHPVFPNRPTIQIEQPYHDLINPYLFYAHVTAEAVGKCVRAMISERPAIERQLGQFLERSRAMHEESRLLPDVWGNGNFMLDQRGQLLIIDGQPTGADEPKVQAGITRNLAYLESALATV